MDIILAYLGLALPVYLLTLLLIINLKSRIKYLCNEASDVLERYDCKGFLTSIKISIIIGLIPVINIFILVFWIIMFFLELPNTKLGIIDKKLTKFVNYLFLDKKD